MSCGNLNDSSGSSTRPLQATPHPALRSARFGTALRIAILALIGLTFGSFSTARAQDDAANEFGDAAVAPAEVPADVPADAPANAGAANNTNNGESAAKPPQNILSWTFEALGWPYVIIFLALSFTLVSLLVMNILTARRDNLCPQELVENFDARLNEKDVQGAYDLARSDESVLGQVLSAGLSKLARGYNHALEGMQEVGEEESMKLEHRLSYMALIGNISPMVGLLGTVQGMITSFQVIAKGGSTPKPSELAEGISTALFTTLVGLLIAIPAIAAFNILRNRVARLLLEVGVTSENLMSRFEDIQPQAPTKK